MSGRFKWERSIRDSDLPPNTRLVLLTMATYMDRDGFARPSQETLASASGLSVRAVRRNLQGALEAGWLAKLRQGRHTGRGASYASEYQAVIPAAGGQEWPAADGSEGVDNPPQPDGSGLLRDSQEDAGVPQAATNDPATGHQWPPNSLNIPSTPPRCSDCDGSGWISTTYFVAGVGEELEGVARCRCATTKARTA